jgi:hypothetical protein
MNNDDPFVRYPVTTLYHFTDRRNLPGIRELGGLFSFAKLKERRLANFIRAETTGVRRLIKQRAWTITFTFVSGQLTRWSF